MSTLRVSNLQNEASANNQITLGTDGFAQINGVAMPSSGPLSSRNLIVNGGMQVAQRTTSLAMTSSSGDSYVLDRFLYRIAVGGGGVTYSQSTDAPTGFSNSLKLDVTTADTDLGASDQYKLEYRIEGLDVAHLEWGTANAQTVTLSFWVKSNLTGNTQVSVANNSNNRYYVAPFTIDSSDTWEKKTLTIEGDTSGTWSTDNGIGIRLRWGSFGSSFETSSLDQWVTETSNQLNQRSDSPINFVSSDSNEFFITGLQLEVGQVATPFEHRSFGDELRRCQRYFQSMNVANMKFTTARWDQSSGVGECNVYLRETMRSAPSFAFTGTWDTGGGWGGDPVMTLAREDFVVLTTTVSTLAASAVKVLRTETAGATISFAAEL